MARHQSPQAPGEPHPPADENQLLAAEQKFGVELSEDWRELYRGHDGMHTHGNLGSLFHGMHFMPLEEVVRDHDQDTSQPHAPIPVRAADPGVVIRDMHNPKWVPFARSGSTLLRVDMDPAGNTLGQVIFTDHDDNTVILMAPSLHAFLGQFATDLEAGLYFLSEEAMREGNEFLDCTPEIDVVNWAFSARWKHLARGTKR